MSNALSWLRENRRVTLPAALLLVIVAVIVLAPFFLQSPFSTNPVDRLEGPSGAHLLGTDGYGRDVLARLLVGGRYSLGLAFMITACSAVAGVLIGLVSGFYRAADAVLMRVMDAWMAFPGLVLAMALVVVLGASMSTEVIALTIMFTPFTARVIRARTLSVSARTFVQAARVSGMPRRKILFVHVLPNVLPLALVQVVLLAASAMLVDGALSFLGLGVASPTPTWGNMIAENRAYLTTTPLLVVAPGCAIAICALLLNITGGALRAIIDPEVREREHLDRVRRLRARARRTLRA